MNEDRHTVSHQVVRVLRDEGSAVFAVIGHLVCLLADVVFQHIHILQVQASPAKFLENHSLVDST